MVDSPTGADAPTARRHRRNERRRQRIKRAAAIVAGVAVFAGFVLLATDLVRIGGDETPSLAGTVHASDTRGFDPTASTSAPARQCRTLTTAEPLRLWVGGDSLAGS